MDFKFSKGSSDAPQQESPGEKKNQNALLVLLLLLVGGFSYIYFFTGLIKQQEVPKPAETPAPQVVKIPMPSRDGITSVPDAKTKDQGKSTVTTKTEVLKSVQGQPVAAVVPTAKEPQQPVKPKEESKKTEPAKTVVKKAQPAPVAEKKVSQAVVAKLEDKKTIVDKKQMPTDKKAEPVGKHAAKKVAVADTTKHKKTVSATSVVANEGVGSAWTLLVGHYVLEEALSTDMGRVRKAGFEPVVKVGARKKSAMNRLELAGFADRAGALAAIAKLKRHTSDAFIIEQGGKHVVYAGSYLLDARAASEKERLNTAGFPVTLKHVEIAIPTQGLTIGPFSDKKAADAAFDKLKVAGIKVTLVKQ